MSKRRGEEKKRNQAELKRKQDKARNKIKILNGFSCTWEFRYTKYNKQGHEIEHKRDVERNREEKQKSEKKRMSWMLEESLLKPTRRIKIFQAQCCAMRCMSLYFCCVFSERQRWEWEKRRGDCCYSRGPQEIVFLFIQLYVTLEVRLWSNHQSVK